MDDKGNFTVKGNGEYTLELPTDENGEVVQFPDPMEIFKCNFESTIDANDIKTIVNSIKPSLATI